MLEAKNCLVRYYLTINKKYKRNIFGNPAMARQEAIDLAFVLNQKYLNLFHWAETLEGEKVEGIPSKDLSYINLDDYISVECSKDE
jgi:hypothetical protein